MKTVTHTVRFQLHAKNGQMKNTTEESFTFTRRLAKQWLTMINDGRPIDAGHIKLRGILVSALQLGGWKKITIRYSKCS